MTDAGTPDPRLLSGLRLLRAHKWFEAHEELEALWQDTAEGEWRDGLQGVIQHLVALEHLRRGNALGAFNVSTRARGKIAKLPEWQAGIGIGPWDKALLDFYAKDVLLGDRVRQGLEGAVSSGEVASEIPELPALETWPLPPLTDELEAFL